MRQDLGVFFRSLRSALGGKPFPYVWVPELHADGQRFHAHFAVGRHIKWQLIRDVWGHGHIGMDRLTDLPVGSESLAESRLAARYLGKYVSKSFEVQSVPRRHRYDVAQGFTPKRMQVWGRSPEQVIGLASDLLGGLEPERFWSSSVQEGWQGPPAIWAQWS